MLIFEERQILQFYAMHLRLITFLAFLLFAFWSWSTSKIDTLNLYWYTSKPFIYMDKGGDMVGIEPEMFYAFRDFMSEKGHEIYLNWIKTNDFGHILEIIRDSTDVDAVGVSAMSITDDRRVYADFATPYLPDITVLVSSKGTPIVNSFDEMSNMMSSMDGITIRETKYESLLLSLKSQLGLSFDIIYITSDGNVLEGVGEAEGRFGFIDLPIYMLQVGNVEPVTRQNFFTIKGQGYSFILPKKSGWKKHIDAFIQSDAYVERISEIISRHLGEELYEFIDEIYTGDELGTSILTKEKEMQLALIKNANLKLEKEQAVTRFLILGFGAFAAFVLVIGFLYYKNQRTTKILLGQRDQIDEQEADIRQKNEQLMNRNAQLITLNEDKNNLVKILAHDIRSPLAQILMIMEIMDQKLGDNLNEDETKLLGQVTSSAERINQMVTKFLDVDGLEENRAKVLNERVDINSILNDIGQRYRPIASKKNIELSIQLCGDHNIIRTDHLLLLLVLENLVSNAVKFSASNTVVELITECAYDSVIFKVCDEGPGFSDEDKKKVFSRFQKLSAKPTAGESSTGLGLSIVKQYVQDLGGKIWLESKKGKGATFFVKLTV